MSVAARSLLFEFLPPIAAVGAAVTLRLPVMAGGLLLLGAPLAASVRFLLALGMSRNRGGLDDVGLPALQVQLSGQFSEIGAERLAQHRIGSVHRHVDGAGASGHSDSGRGLIVSRQVQENFGAGG